MEAIERFCLSNHLCGGHDSPFGPSAPEVFDVRHAQAPVCASMMDPPLMIRNGVYCTTLAQEMCHFLSRREPTKSCWSLRENPSKPSVCTHQDSPMYTACPMAHVGDGGNPPGTETAYRDAGGECILDMDD
jgi:hypothetical protein